ncbi:MAG: hypothetical protein H0T84_11340 [Tatlockia sp.]|nr:hypothetical protein [Tatlockia sp.]
MVQKHSTQFTSAFFGSKLPIASAHVSKQKQNYVNVGNGDLYIAAAAAMIDSVLSIKSAANEALAKKLLELHADRFAQKTTKGLPTFVEKLDELLKIPAERAQFLLELALVSYEKADKVLKLHQENYLGAFVANDKRTSPQEMRLLSTLKHKSVIDVLATVFQVPIGVRVVELNKELHAKWPQNYDPGNDRVIKPNPAAPELVASPIFMQLQGNDYYIPKLNKPEFFEFINSFNIEPLRPDIVEHPQDPDVARAQLAAADKIQRLREETQSTVKWLTSMVFGNPVELTKEDLIDIYIKSLDQSNLSRSKYFGLNNGTQHFFEAIQKGSIRAISLPAASQDELVTIELIHAIARAIGLGIIEPGLIYEAQEKSSHKFRN